MSLRKVYPVANSFASGINLLKVVKKNHSNGFTLVELLVAISILAVIGTFLLVNFGIFKEDQSLQIVSSKLQSFIRQAQINATAGVLCDGKSGASWSVEYVDNEVLMKCQVDTVESQVKVFPLEQKVTISKLITSGTEKIIGDQYEECDDLKITFSHILGRVTFYSSDLNCREINDQFAGFVLLKNGDKKFVMISKGGVVYVQEYVQ